MKTNVIEKTTNYSMFKTHKSNRPIDEKLVKVLMDAIQEKNLLSSKPVVIDKDEFIMDGQHRIEAAKRLGIPVFFIKDDEIEVKDVISTNTNLKTWTLNDYLNYYSNQGIKDYEDLYSFINKENLPINIAIQILNGTRSPWFFKDFKNGHYKYPVDEELKEAMAKKIQIKEIIDFIKKKTSGPKSYLDRVTFYGALVEFFNCKAFSYETFIKKLNYKIDFIHPCTKHGEYLNIFREIYNWKNQTPISIDME